jgi:spermidine dehydrogenase
MTKSRQDDAVVGEGVDNDLHDDELGMGRPIERRDFLQGAAVTLATAVGGLVPALAFGADPDAGVKTISAAQDQPGYNPPTLTGMRGSHPGSFETAHAIRDDPAFLTQAEDPSRAPRRGLT